VMIWLVPVFEVLNLKIVYDQHLLHWRSIIVSPSRTSKFYLSWVYRCWLFWSLLNVSFGILSKRYLVVPKGIEILQSYMYKGQSHFNFGKLLQVIFDYNTRQQQLWNDNTQYYFLLMPIYSQYGLEIAKMTQY
jgi:hypothetical protein